MGGVTSPRRPVLRLLEESVDGPWGVEPRGPQEALFTEEQEGVWSLVGLPFLSCLHPDLPSSSANGGGLRGLPRRGSHTEA